MFSGGFQLGNSRIIHCVVSSTVRGKENTMGTHLFASLIFISSVLYMFCKGSITSMNASYNSGTRRIVRIHRTTQFVNCSIL